MSQSREQKELWKEYERIHSMTRKDVENNR